MKPGSLMLVVLLPLTSLWEFSLQCRVRKVWFERGSGLVQFVSPDMPVSVMLRFSSMNADEFRDRKLRLGLTQQ
jgi:hypothetical protein